MTDHPENSLPEDILRDVKLFIKESEGADSTERALMRDDLRFVYVPDSQWDDQTRIERGNRPCYVFNKLIGSVNQVIGDQRQARPQIKVRGIDGDSDPDLAEVFAGLIRNIEDTSDATSIYDMAYKYAVSGGYGAWRILPEFANEKSFEQEIFIKPIFNPFTVFWDPVSQDPCKRDQMQCCVAERISRDAHKAQFGKEKSEKAANIQVSRDGQGWFTKDQIRIAEYFKKIPVEKEIAMLTDGRTVELTDETRDALKKAGPDAAQIEKDSEGKEKTRTAKTFIIRWWKVDGAQILDGPIDYEWKFIPIVKLCGRAINIEGRMLTQSLIRHAKDAQRIYNYDRTTMSEVVANAPRAVWLATEKMLKGHENEWSRANAENRPVLFYDHDQNVPGGAPQRVDGAEVPAALIGMAAMDADDIKSATGLFDASLGEQGPQESGEAIRARQREGDAGSFEFMDNFVKALKFTGDILVDMIPKVYDTERTVRILGLDGKESFKKINAYDEITQKRLDLSVGRFDVKISTGPAFSTQRREAFHDLIEAARIMPVVAKIAPDLIFKNLDVPGSDELEKRLRGELIKDGTIQPTEEEAREITPQQPDPIQEALVATEQSKQQMNIAKAAKDQQTVQQSEQTFPIELLKIVDELVQIKLDNRFREEEIKIAREREGDIRITAND